MNDLKKIKDLFSLTSLKKLKNKLNEQSTTKFTLWVCTSVFLFSYWLISRNNGFFSGDMAIIGTITRDFGQGKFYSWYFYGQDYFGNLEPIFLALLTKITGNSINSLYFWEHFWYYVSSILIMLSIPKVNRWQAIVSTFALYFGVRYYNYLYFPQGFAFTLLILIVFYYIFQRVYSNELKLRSWVFVLTGIFTTISIWFNPTVVVILPVLFVIYIYKIYSKQITLEVSSVYSTIIGLVIGAIPFTLAYIATSGKNLDWFISNRASNLIGGIVYFTTDFIYFFVDEKSLKLGSTAEILKSSFTDPRNLFAILFSLAIIGVILISFKSWKEMFVRLAFLIFSAAVLINKELGVDSPLFDKIRYMIPVYTFILIVIIAGQTTAAKDKISKVFKIACSTIIIIIACFGISRSWNLLKNPNRGLQTYEIVTGKLAFDYETKYLYCENFHDMCMAISYLGYEYGINVQMMDEEGGVLKSSLRNPSKIGVVDKAYAENKNVYSLVPEKSLNSACKVVEVFSLVPESTKYYLLEGKNSDCK